ncbi:MAG: phosphoenolpyruvate--protein phosphotransferase [Melioribacteraceae bacterium]|nr:phosphoenolpyruvate--protein phosphotransferase [Melioribacteraceae bacterium]MCF8264585.1 phosphoenolpyruvate--protein phosphotransferase [Melioribacteraceae bacterium]MCF8412320.1 phosphoenolpyruvate--protein phosphotransferase [Melioribacteraceae bacterium]
MEDSLNIIKGIAAAPGIVMAEAHVFRKTIEEVNDETITNIDEALENLEAAIERSKRELRKIFSLAVDKLGQNRAAIFEAQIMILDDPVLIETIKNRIRKEAKSPAFIVNNEISKYQSLMASSKEPYMKERSQDIEDIKNRIIRNFGKRRWKSRIENHVIVVTESLTPADTVLFSRANVKGYVTDTGGLTSHAAIVARSLSVPAVVGLHDASVKIQDKDFLIIDGYHGHVVINPDEKQIAYYNKKIQKINQYDSELSVLKDEKAITTDGREVVVRANLDLTDEIELILNNGAQGVGLVRTEQIFQDREFFPDEEEQYGVYADLAEKIYPEIVVIRVFDIGGDKVLPFGVKEPNPFLGWRGIRFLLDNQELFKTQIKAILRASVHKNLYILIPMITSIYEVRISHEIINSCKSELEKEGINFDRDIKVGIMIEVPSAAVMAKDFAKEVDFISIGTNDLIQYLLAVDRGNEIISAQYKEFHPAVVRTLAHIITNGKMGDVRVSMCGEMASDVLALPLLIGLGLDSVSVAPSLVPLIKKIVRSVSFEETKALSEVCLSKVTEAEIKSTLEEFVKKRLKVESENIL